MSRVVDERVVSMQFDNKQFEKNVSTSMSTLDKLKQKLNLSGASKGLEDIGAASKRIDMSMLSNGVEAVRAKFSALQIIGITALQNITNSAINAGKRIAASLTIDPIKTGLSEYETQLNAIQTILANTESKGSTLKDVNAALDELNLYADKTIYNFTEMTRNIGTFTAAGVDLDKSVSAIKGIANLAAVSGSTSQQAATAMYQLSQALSTGTVKLMDWNSVVNAGMGGQVFQDSLKETAKVHGVAIDDILKKQGSFRESLSEGWLTSEILLETLNKFTGDLNEEQLKSLGYTDQQIQAIIKLGNTANDAATKVKTFTQLLDTLKEAAQSGWAQTWKLIIGDFGEAKELWTSVSDALGKIINDSAEARNKLLGGTFTTGWKQLLGEGIMDEKGYSYYVKTVAKEHGVAIDDMIKQEGSLEKAVKKGLGTGEISSEMLAEALNKLSKEYDTFTEEQIGNLGYTKDQVKALSELNEKVQNGSISMEEFAGKIQRLSGRELAMQSFANVFKAILSVIKPIKEAFSEIFPPTTSEQLYNIIKAISEFTSKLILSEKASENLKRTFKGIFAVFDIIVYVVKKVVGSVIDLIGEFSGLGSGILESTASLGDFLVRIRDSIKSSETFTTVLSTVTKGLKTFVSFISDKLANLGLFDTLVKGLKFVWNIAKGIFGKITGLVGELFNSLGEGNGAGFLNLLSAGGLLVAVAKFKKFLNNFEGVFDSIKSVFGEIDDFFGISGIIEGVTGALKSFQDKLKAETIKTLAIAIAILAGSLLVLSLIDKDKLTSAMTAITVSLGILMAGLAIISKIGTGNIKSIVSLTLMANSLLLASLALKVLGSMEWNEIAVSLVGMTAALAEMVAVTYAISLIKPNKKGIAELVIIANALLLISIPLKILGTMEWNEIWKSLTAMSLAFVALLGVTLAVSKIHNNMRGIKEITKLAGALLLVSASLKILGTMEWDEIWRALTAMSLSFVALLGVTLAISKIPNNMRGVNELVKMSGALILLGISLKIIGSMGWEEIGKGLAGMAGTLVVLGAALFALSKVSSGPSMIALSVGLLAMSVAITAISLSLLLLGSLNIQTIVRGLLAFSAAVYVLIIASELLAGSVAVILSVAGAMALLGVSMVLIGAGLTMISVALTTMITGFLTGGAALINGIINLLKSIIMLIPFICVELAKGLIEFCKVIAEGAPIIGEAILSVILSALVVLESAIPAIAEGIFKIILGILEATLQYLPQITEVLVNLFIKMIELTVNFMPMIIQTAIKAIGKFFDGIVDALKNVDPSAILKAVLAVGIMAALLAALSAVAALVPSAMLGLLGVGAVIAELALVLAAIGALSRIPGLSSLINDGGNLLGSIGAAIGKFVGGIIGGIGAGISSTLPTIASKLSSFMTNLQPFIAGISSLNAGVLENAKTLTQVLLTITAENILDQIFSGLLGVTSMDEFASKLITFGKGIKGFADQVTGIDCEAVRAASEAGKNLAEMANNIPKKGGLWQLFSGSGDLDAFGTKLVSFGEGIKGFADKVTGIDCEAVRAASEAGKNLAEMANNIPKKGGLFSIFTDETVNMNDFSSQLKGFGTGIKEFAKSSEEINLESVRNGVTASNELSAMAKSLPKSGGLLQVFSGEVKMDVFGSQLKGFGTAIKDFVKEMSQVGDISGAAKQLDTLNYSLKTFTVTGVESFTSTLEKSKSRVEQAVTNMLNAAINAVKNKTQHFVDAGKDFIERFVIAISSYTQKVKTVFTEMIETAVNAISGEDVRGAFFAAGAFLAEGFALGIESKAYMAKARAAAMAKAAAQAAANELQEKSPSKVGYKIGSFFGEGFTNGINDYSEDAYQSSAEMASSAKSGLSKAITKIRELIENGINTQPTIRPVLDLSNVKAGAGVIGGLLDNNITVGALSKAGYISSVMNKNQNGSDDVALAIKDLKDTIKNNSGDTYNINGVTYDSGSELSEAIKTIIRVANVERRR